MAPKRALKVLFCGVWLIDAACIGTCIHVSVHMGVIVFIVFIRTYVHPLL